MILTILKVIGIILLVILSLIILILAVLLLVPIKYRFSAEYFENPDVLATVRYAPVGLKAQVSFRENALQYTVRALGGVIMTNTDAKLSWIGRKIAGSSEEDRTSLDEAVTSDNSDADNVPDKDIDVSNDTSVNSSDIVEENWDEKDSNTDDNKEDFINYNDGHKEKADNKSNNKKKIKKPKDTRPLSEKIAEKTETLKKKYKEIKDKLIKLNKKKDSLIKIYKSKRFEVAKTDVIKYIKAIFKAIKPKHVEGRVHFGLKDPAATGEIMGGLATILPLYDGVIDIRPDFEKQIIEGLIKGYGKIRLVSFAVIGLKVLLNRNLFKVIKRVQTIIEA